MQCAAVSSSFGPIKVAPGRSERGLRRLFFNHNNNDTTETTTREKRTAHGVTIHETKVGIPQRGHLVTIDDARLWCLCENVGGRVSNKGRSMRNVNMSMRRLPLPLFRLCDVPVDWPGKVVSMLGLANCRGHDIVAC